MRGGRLAVLAVFAGLAVFAIASRSARAVSPSTRLDELVVEHWDRSVGLPTDAVRAVARDADGLVYLGTDAGLFTFDGQTFTRYSVATHPELPSDHVSKLTADGRGVWMGTPLGLARMEDGVIRAYGPELGVPAARVIDVAVDRAGRLWVATTEGVVVRASGERLERPTSDPACPIDRRPCPGLAELPDGSMALACSDLCFARDGHIQLGPELASSASTLAVGPDGVLWVGTDHGLYRVVAGRAELALALATEVYTLAVDGHGAAWIGTADGLQRLVPGGRPEAVLLPDGRAIDGPESIVVSGEEILAGTQSQGLVRVAERPFRVLDARRGASVNTADVGVGRDGAVWVSGDNDPTLHIFAGGARRDVALPSPVVTSVEDAAGGIWLGTVRGLVHVTHDQPETVPLGATPSPVLALAVGPGRELYAGGEGGLWRVGGAAGEAASAALVPGGEHLEVSALALAQDGRRLWIGTAAGLCHLDLVGPGARPVCPDDATGLGRVLVITLYAAPDGAVWVAPLERGLVRVRGDEVKSVGVRQGLPWATVYALLPDSGGRLWMSGPTGVARVDGGALDAVADGRAPRLAPRVFGRGDGLPVDETNGGGNVAARGPDGRLWFATPRGTVFIDPAAVAEPPRSPASVLEEVRAGARRLARNGGEVAPDERTLLIRYTAPTFDRPDALRFRYRLDGVDADWVDAGSRRVAMYTGLDPGVRTFRVAALADGAADYGPEASIALELRPAFVETAVFKALLAALALALVALVHRWRTRQLVARQRLLGHLVDERTRELAHAQSELVALNADLEQRVDRAVTSLRAAERMAAYGHTVAGVAHEVRQPLFALGTTAFVLGDKLRDRPELAGELQLLDRETRRMNRVMEELLDFAKPRELLLGPTDLAGLVREAVDTFRAEHDPEARVPVTLALDEALGEVRLDAGRLQQVLVNLLHNAQKHAAGLTRVTVATLAAGPGRVAIEVGDDGRGIAPGDLERVFEPFFTTGGTGLGLAIARRIVVEHGGDMTVRSSAAGTTFRIELPLDGPAHAP